MHMLSDENKNLTNRVASVSSHSRLLDTVNMRKLPPHKILIKPTQERVSKVKRINWYLNLIKMYSAKNNLGSVIVMHRMSLFSWLLDFGYSI